MVEAKVPLLGIPWLSKAPVSLVFFLPQDAVSRDTSLTPRLRHAESWALRRKRKNAGEVNWSICIPAVRGADPKYWVLKSELFEGECLTYPNYWVL